METLERKIEKLNKILMQEIGKNKGQRRSQKRLNLIVIMSKEINKLERKLRSDL